MTNPISWVDDFLPEPQRKQVYAFLLEPNWRWGWKSTTGDSDQYRFWHRHFGGNLDPDHNGSQQYDCLGELTRTAPLLAYVWGKLSQTLANHKLVRCYANLMTYGQDGETHTDSAKPESFTTVYYPHGAWHADWGGELQFFNTDKTDVIGSCFPRGNRLCVFSGIVPHCARGVSRSCPVPRVTLMFKTEAPQP